MNDSLFGMAVTTSRYLPPWEMIWLNDPAVLGEGGIVMGVKIFWLLSDDLIEALEKMVAWNIKRGLERFDALQKEIHA